MSNEAIYITPRHFAGCPTALLPLAEKENCQKFVDSLKMTMTSYLAWVAMFPQDTENPSSPLRDVMWQFILNLSKVRGLICSLGYPDLADILERADKSIEHHGPGNELHNYNGLTIETRGTLTALDILDLPASFAPARGSFTPAQSVLVSRTIDFRATYGDPECILVLPEVVSGESALVIPPAVQPSSPRTQTVHLRSSAPPTPQPTPSASDHPCIFSSGDPSPSPALVDITPSPYFPMRSGVDSPSASTTATQPRDLTSRFFLRAIAARRLHAAGSTHRREGTPSRVHSVPNNRRCDSPEKEDTSNPASPTNSRSDTTTTPPPSLCAAAPATKRNHDSSEGTDSVLSNPGHSPDTAAPSSPPPPAPATKRRRDLSEGEDATQPASPPSVTSHSSNNATLSSPLSPASAVGSSRDSSEREETAHRVPSPFTISCASDAASSPPPPSPTSPNKRHRDSSEEEDGLRPAKRVIRDWSPPAPNPKTLTQLRRSKVPRNKRMSRSSGSASHIPRTRTFKYRSSVAAPDLLSGQGSDSGSVDLTPSPDSGYCTSSPPSPHREIVEEGDVGTKVREVARWLLRASKAAGSTQRITGNSSRTFDTKGKRKRTCDPPQCEAEANSGNFGRPSKKSRR